MVVVPVLRAPGDQPVRAQEDPRTRQGRISIRRAVVVAAHPAHGPAVGCALGDLHPVGGAHDHPARAAVEPGLDRPADRRAPTVLLPPVGEVHRGEAPRRAGGQGTEVSGSGEAGQGFTAHAPE